MIDPTIGYSTGNGFNLFDSVDSSGNVLVAGSTSSTNMPVTSNAYMSQLNNGGTGGTSDCFVALLQRSDLTPTYLSYMNVGNGTTAGGNGTGGDQIGCGGFEDSSGKFDLGGNTFSTDAFNVGTGGANLANGFEPNFPTGGTKVTYLMQLDPTKSGTAALAYASYYGGGGTTNVKTGTVDIGNGVIAIAGATTSNSTVGDIPLVNAFQSTNLAAGTTGGTTGFVVVVDTTTTGIASLGFSSYFGGSGGNDLVNTIAYDANDPTAYRLVIGGQTVSSDFPTLNSLQTLQGTQNAFVAELKVPTLGQSFAGSLYFSTLIGGGAVSGSGNGERTDGVGVDSSDVVYATARTISANFFGNTNPTTTVNGFQLTCSSCGATTPEPDTTIWSMGTLGTATLQSISVSPSSASIQVDQTEQFKAVAFYSDGSIQDVTTAASWGSSNTGIATVNEGLATGVTVGGPVTITASLSGIEGTASLTVTAATSYPLTVSTSGTGFGTETSTPAGINCPTTCRADFAVGSQVTLTATANGGSSFTGWSGAGCSGTGTCTVTMSAAESVTASYTSVPSYQLLLSMFGPGAGTVTSTPSGINCTSTCSGNYNPGTQVTLTETPATGSTFAGWGGGCGGTGNTCTVTMNSTEDISATFNAVSFPATVTTLGAGTGTVTSQPSGIDCPPTCSAYFNNGSTTILTANAAAGSAFDGWSGACTGTNGTCSLAMTAAQTAKATFVPTTNLTLTVVFAGQTLWKHQRHFERNVQQHVWRRNGHLFGNVSERNCNHFG